MSSSVRCVCCVCMNPMLMLFQPFLPFFRSLNPSHTLSSLSLSLSLPLSLSVSSFLLPAYTPVCVCVCVCVCVFCVRVLCCVCVFRQIIHVQAAKLLDLAEKVSTFSSFFVSLHYPLVYDRLTPPPVAGKTSISESNACRII